MRDGGAAAAPRFLIFGDPISEESERQLYFLNKLSNAARASLALRGV